MIYLLSVSSNPVLNILRNQWLSQLRQSTVSRNKNYIVLGIETSCDDTGCGIVDSKGRVLGNALYSQQMLHSKYGGIIPPVAQNLHRKNITDLCEHALKSANIKLHNVDAIAATVKPGLPLSLSVGLNFGVRLSMIGNKPFIPIHHMEAHALVARMSQQVDFPYLVLLISGGHCLLAIVKNVDTFYLLGTTIDDAPGEAFEKVSRRLKMRNLLDFMDLSGGQAIETAASRAEDTKQFIFPVPLAHCVDCNFSFSGLKTAAVAHILECERMFNIIGDKVIPHIYNLCASFQLAITRHLCQRTQRAMDFIDRYDLLPKHQRTLVISGGVACNNFISKSLSAVCSEMGYTCIRPPPYLCTDNGLMIAWNGMERWTTNSGVLVKQKDIANVNVEKKSPLGTDWTSKIREENIKCKWIKIKNI